MTNHAAETAYHAAAESWRVAWRAEQAAVAARTQADALWAEAVADRARADDLWAAEYLAAAAAV